MIADSDKKNQDRLREAMRLLENVARLPLKHDKELQRAVKRAWQGGGER